MCRKLTIAWALPLPRTIAGPAIADDPPVPGPSPMARSGAWPSSQSGIAGLGDFTPALHAGARPSGGAAGEPIMGPIGPPTDGAGSGAFTGAAGPRHDRGRHVPRAASRPAWAGSPGLGRRLRVSSATSSRSPRPGSSPPPPLSRFSNLPTPTPPPHVNNGNPGIVSATDDVGPLQAHGPEDLRQPRAPSPRDRFFYSFNYFDNLNASVIARRCRPCRTSRSTTISFGDREDVSSTAGRQSASGSLSTRSASTSNVQGLAGPARPPGTSHLPEVHSCSAGNCLFSGGPPGHRADRPGAFGGNKYYSYFRDTSSSRS